MLRIRHDDGTHSAKMLSRTLETHDGWLLLLIGSEMNVEIDDYVFVRYCRHGKEEGRQQQHGRQQLSSRKGGGESENTFIINGN
eukprot:scaffold48466_cov76-Cyclotella_meneghiniana.AAC.2